MKEIKLMLEKTQSLKTKRRNDSSQKYVCKKLPNITHFQAAIHLYQLSYHIDNEDLNHNLLLFQIFIQGFDHSLQVSAYVQLQTQNQQLILILLSVQIKKLMSKSSKVMREDTQPTFAKGMTLQQYMNKNMGKPPPDAIDGQQVQEENLYQSTINRKIEGVKSKHDLYFINEIDEQSVQDSIEHGLDEESMGLLKSQRTKETLIENNQVGENKFRTRINSIAMNATALFKSSTQQKNTFRIKRTSMSPTKKKTEPLSTYGSITLYGSKFAQQVSKDTFKEPQLVTFYGKLKHNTHDAYQKDAFLTLRKQESKGNFTKKHQIEINQLIEYESNINNKYVPRNSPHQIKIEGIKDRLSQRKNKFC